jgi:hypothetical protein
LCLLRAGGGGEVGEGSGVVQGALRLWGGGPATPREQEPSPLAVVAGDGVFQGHAQVLVVFGFSPPGVYAVGHVKGVGGF